MDYLSNIIALLIVLFIFFFPILARVLKRKAQESVIPSQEPIVNRVLKPPPRPIMTSPPLSENFEFHRQIEERQLKTAIDPHFKDEVTSYHFHSKGHTSAKKRKKKRTLAQKMVIYATLYERYEP